MEILWNMAKARSRSSFALGKRIGALQSKIDKYHKASYEFKKEKIQYKKRRVR
jgi:hypothetical protein